VSAERFPFRPWVRSTCRRAMLWGMGLVVALGAFARLLPSDERGAWGRGFGVLLAYSVLFVGSLAKIWWTAGRPAVEVDAEGFSYQPLHTFRPRRIPFARVLAVNPRPGTEALRFVVEERGEARELFLNLAVVKGQHRFVELLGEGLVAAALVPVPGRERSWRRIEWVEVAGVMGVGG
jgi:uncharacterized membrane protein YedE/YeeE